MLKKSTLLFVATFFLLFIGLSDYGYGCHRDRDGDPFNGNEPHGKDPIPGGCPDPDDPGGDEDTTGGKSEGIALIMKFDDLNFNNDPTDPFDPFDNVRSDGDGPYVNQEGAGVGAAERSQPNPAAGIDLGLSAKKIKNRNGRQLDLNITCAPIDLDFPRDGDFDGEIDVNNCKQLTALLDGEIFSGVFPTCGEDNFCSLGASVRPYKVSCPNGECPDVFTMDPDTPELMSFRLSFAGGNLLIEVASAIGGDGGLDPGRCLSLLETTQRKAFLDGECIPDSNCNVEVTAFDLGNAGTFPGEGSTEGAEAGDRENDAWQVVANGVTALICNRNTSEVLGKATLFFGFEAINKEGATDPFPPD